MLVVCPSELFALMHSEVGASKDIKENVRLKALQTSFLHHQIVDQETKDKSYSQLAENQSLHSLQADDGDQDRHESLHLQL